MKQIAALLAVALVFAPAIPPAAAGDSGGPGAERARLMALAAELIADGGENVFFPLVKKRKVLFKVRLLSSERCFSQSE